MRIEVEDPGHRRPVLRAATLDAVDGRGLLVVDKLATPTCAVSKPHTRNFDRMTSCALEFHRGLGCAERRGSRTSQTPDRVIETSP